MRAKEGLGFHGGIDDSLTMEEKYLCFLCSLFHLLLLDFFFSFYLTMGLMVQSVLIRCVNFTLMFKESIKEGKAHQGKDKVI